jgi:hypothetical protein
MHFAKKLALLCAMALAAMALGASTASAQTEEPVEIWEEDGSHCEPCHIHVTGESELHPVIGNPISQCEDEFEAEVWEDEFDENRDPEIEEIHQGHIYDYDNHDESATQPCTRQMCNGVMEPADEIEWPITNMGETTTNAGHMTVRFCLDTKANPGAAGAHCTVEIDVTEEVSPTHHYVFRAVNDPCFGGLVRLNGEWETEELPEEHGAIEIIHQP